MGWDWKDLERAVKRTKKSKSISRLARRLLDIVAIANGVNLPEYRQRFRNVKEILRGKMKLKFRYRGVDYEA